MRLPQRYVLMSMIDDGVNIVLYNISIIEQIDQNMSKYRPRQDCVVGVMTQNMSTLH